MGGSTFRGHKVMRMSAVSWQTTAEDIERIRGIDPRSAAQLAAALTAG
jgi:hypothetical protein